MSATKNRKRFCDVSAIAVFSVLYTWLAVRLPHMSVFTDEGTYLLYVRRFMQGYAPIVDDWGAEQLSLMKNMASSDARVRGLFRAFPALAGVYRGSYAESAKAVAYPKMLSDLRKLPSDPDTILHVVNNSPESYLDAGCGISPVKDNDLHLIYAHAIRSADERAAEALDGLFTSKKA